MAFSYAIIFTYNRILYKIGSTNYMSFSDLIRLPCVNLKQHCCMQQYVQIVFYNSSKDIQLFFFMFLICSPEILKHDGFVSCFLSNTFWLVSVFYYLYITFLGYSSERSLLFIKYIYDKDIRTCLKFTNQFDLVMYSVP